MNAAYARAELDILNQNADDGMISTTTSTRTVAVTHERPPLSQSARSFVSRVFSLPSHIIRGHPHPSLEGLSSASSSASSGEEDSFDWDTASPDDDVVLFPLVGFQCDQDGPNHYRTLPSKSNAACRLRPAGSEEEKVVGWFSKACHLDLFGDHYCEEPTK